MATVNFLMLQARAGTEEGARVRFAQLVVDVVKVLHGNVRDIRANPGDWGIDAFVGTLDEGESVMVWQSKFFINEVAKAQQTQIDESFASCMKAAEREGHVVRAWTLCIPRSMDGPTTKWWEGWRKEQEKKHSLVIELWEEARFREIFRAPQMELIAAEYFGAEPVSRVRELESPADAETFDEMLFIKQLVAAQLDPAPAKYEFFNAELLRREASDKSGERAQKFLDGLQEVLYGMWSHRWQASCERNAGDPLLPGLHSEVMSAIEQLHAAPASGDDVVPMHVAHRKGAMHQVVETGRAGWIREFRKLAEEHGV
jgi:hypothetical protein